MSDGSGSWSNTGTYTDAVTGFVYNIYHHSGATGTQNDVYVQTTITNVI